MYVCVCVVDVFLFSIQVEELNQIVIGLLLGFNFLYRPSIKLVYGLGFGAKLSHLKVYVQFNILFRAPTVDKFDFEAILVENQ